MWQRQLGLDLEIPDDFGNWLAGFTAGDGCFTIRSQPPKYVKCFFTIRLRDDDFDILQEIQETLGIGKTRVLKKEKGKNRLALWEVCAIGDIVHVLIPLFEKYPIRAKKKRDFLIWSRAARIIHSGFHLTKVGLAEVLALKREMEEGRKYKKLKGD
jgi:hypothetical protein